MTKRLFLSDIIFKEHPAHDPSSCTRQDLSLKLHQCAFSWSDKCAYCESTYDKLKPKLASLATKPSEEILNELRKEIEESLATLEGFFYLNKFNFLNLLKKIELF
jgi:hypothetical protein